MAKFRSIHRVKSAKLHHGVQFLGTFRILAAAFVLALGLGWGASARAATWTVTSTSDARFIDTGSLGYIINYSANSGDTINFATNLSGQSIALNGTWGQLILSGKNLTIDASALPGGITVVAPPSNRFLEVDSGTVVLNRLTIANGAAGGGAGGGIALLGGNLTLNQCTLSGNSGASGGAIYNHSTLTLNQCIVSGNSAGSGGGIYSDGTLALNQCILSTNSVGPGGYGGGIYNTSSGKLAMTNCSVFRNSAAVGGGVASDFGTTLTMTGCTLSNNSAGGGSGGGISSSGTLTLNQCTLSENSALHGGGIYIAYNISGTIMMTDCTLFGNSVSGSTGYGGGGILNASPSIALALANCTLSGNSANGTTYGGGGINNAGVLAMTNCTLSGNSANGTTYGGGGIYNGYSVLGTGSGTLNECTLSGNSASNTVVGGGGGLANNQGNLTLNQCTLSGNSASYIVEGGGGGIDNRQGIVNLNQCTLSGNSVPDYAEGGGIYNYLNSSVNLTNSVVAGNSGPFGADIVNFRILNYGGANIVESVYNVAYSATQVNGPAAISAAPLLAPLGNYGGPTQTMPPLPGSPALNAGSDSATNTFATDQRGLPRLVGAHVDIGAVEGVYISVGPIHLTGMTHVANGPASFTFTNSPHLSLTALMTTNLALPQSLWSNLGAPVEAPAGSGHYQFSDPQATNSPRRFYSVH